jgi:hypothetical protein
MQFSGPVFLSTPVATGVPRLLSVTPARFPKDPAPNFGA